MRHVVLSVLTLAFATAAPTLADEPATPTPEAPAASSVITEVAPREILVEISLSKDRKGDLDAIKKAFADVGVIKVRAIIYQAGNPPTNLAIGRNIAAPIARVAMSLAEKYNRGITLLLPEERLAAHYIGFGSSIFDELFQYPVTPEDVKRLADPSLTTDEFHTLYRKLADINTRRTN
jgi:hypothetical protein